MTNKSTIIAKAITKTVTYLSTTTVMESVA